MTRGNQREIDRQRALNRNAGKGESKTGDILLRREADAKALADKVRKLMIKYVFLHVYHLIF